MLNHLKPWRQALVPAMPRTEAKRKIIVLTETSLITTALRSFFNMTDRSWWSPVKGYVLAGAR
jgi:hypothetical protein